MMRFPQEPPVAPPLAGEAEAGKFGMRDGNGLHADPSRAIFPIIRQKSPLEIDLLGTGFYISSNGIFVSAKHVLTAAVDLKTGEQLFPVGILHFKGDGTYLIRPILRFTIHPTADVAVATAAPMNRNSDGAPLTNAALTIHRGIIDVAAHVTTFAYPRYATTMTDAGQIMNVMPAWYDGEITEYLPDGRDRVLLPGACYRTNIVIHHGASGGPVFSRLGTVFGLNSTGWDGTDDSYVSSIVPVLNLSVEDVAMNGQPAGRVAVADIAKAGFILVQPPL